MTQHDHVNIWSKGEVVNYLRSRFGQGLVKDCKLLKVERGHADAFYPKCLEDWASADPANNVETDLTAYNGPSSYHWPRCPKDCPKYVNADDFPESLAQDPHERSRQASQDYVDRGRINELKTLKSTQFDFTKLIAFCEDINRCHGAGSVLAPAVLVRGILDHIPPLFGAVTFKEVANNYQGATKSFRGSMLNLDNSSRKIADAILHTQIRSKEALPTPTQVDFKNDLDVLLQEIVRSLKKI